MFAVFLSLLSTLTSAERFGVDLSVLTDTSDWSCLMSEHDVSFGLVRVFRSTGILDENAPSSIHAAFEAGVKDMHGYIFPCISSSPYSIEHNITCSSPTDQFTSSLKYLEENGVSIHRKSEVDSPHSLRIMWLDIEDEVPSKYFDSNVAVNQAAIAEMRAAAESEGVRLGIYTTKTYWNNIMGNIEGYSTLPLWYPRYDDVNSMDFFQSFAGWESVAIKQTAGDSGFCGISQVDSDYMDI